LSLQKVPLLVLVTGLAALAASVSGVRLFGFSVSGYAWVVPLVVALLMVLRHPGRVLFPWWIWAPWALLVLLYLTQVSAPHAVQRTVMMLSPVVVGMAASASRVAQATILATLQFLRALGIALFLVIAWNTGFISTGVLPEYGSFAASVMTAALLASIFATEYAFGRRSSLGWWGVMQVVPLIALTRTGMVATALTFPLCMGPMRIRRRLLSLALICGAGIFLFSTSRMQARMFYSGSGTLSEMSFDNPNFATGGRSTIWPEFVQEIEKRPWLGHGANASERFASILAEGVAHPHNDWLRLLYDYGYVGTGLFALTLLGQLLHALLAGRRGHGLAKLLFVISASSFVVLPVFMLTDNIVLYAAFFGNLQFALLGLAYALAGRRTVSGPLGSPRTVEATTEFERRLDSIERMRWRLGLDDGNFKDDQSGEA
jgi:O-antigen ligase